LGWPTAITTQGRILELRTDDVIPAYLTLNHPATPTVVAALMRGLLQRSHTRGDDSGMVASAMMRAAAASRAPIPTLPPVGASLPPQSVTAPATPPEIEVPQPYPFPAVSPLPATPFADLPPWFAKPPFHRKDKPHFQRKEPLGQFPRTIFEPGKSPAEQGGGIFPRR
jgi:hypothetical protein